MQVKCLTCCIIQFLSPSLSLPSPPLTHTPFLLFLSNYPLPFSLSLGRMGTTPTPASLAPKFISPRASAVTPGWNHYTTIWGSAVISAPVPPMLSWLPKGSPQIQACAFPSCSPCCCQMHSFPGSFACCHPASATHISVTFSFCSSQCNTPYLGSTGRFVPLWPKSICTLTSEFPSSMCPSLPILVSLAQCLQGVCIDAATEVSCTPLQ